MKNRIIALMMSVLILVTMIPAPVYAVDTDTVIAVQSVADTAGAEIDVAVTIDNNPGVLGATLKITYDAGLTLTGATAGEAFSALNMTKPGKFTSPCNFIWDGQELNADDIADGTIVTLHFTIADDAVSGSEYNIKVSYTDGDIVDMYLNPVEVGLTNGTVSVMDYLYGDLNGDRKVNTTDIIMLRRSIADGYAVTINELAADVNNDQRRNATDVILMRRYIAGGYGVTFPYISDKCNHVMVATAYKEPTYTEEGNIAYWYCNGCGKYFIDENGVTEITREDTILPVLVQDTYEIQYKCEMVLPGNTTFKEKDTYKPTQTKVLQTPQMDKYKFLGWSDKDGKMYGTEIPKGTTGDLILYANWASDRNRAVPVKSLGDPIICEDSDNGQILFVYEIGHIENVPIFEKQNLNVVNGVITRTEMKSQKSILKSNAETIGKTIANTTTNSSAWTLSKDWDETISISEEWLEQQGMDTATAEEFCRNNSNTYNLTNTSGGYSSLISNDNSYYRVSTNKAREENTYSDEQKYTGFNVDGKLSNSTTASLGVSAGLKIPLKVGEGNLGAEAGLSNTFAWEIGAGYENNTYTQDITTGTDSWEKNIDDIKSKSTTSTAEKTWNSSEGFSASYNTSSTESVTKAISELISQKYSKDSSYSTGGSEGESQEYASSNAQEDLYSSSVTYSEEEITTSEISFESTGNTKGDYRLVHAGMARVFAIVGYDIKNKSYYTYTHSVLDDDKENYKEYLDYSFDGTFNDYETSVLPFEIPIFVNDYVNSRIATSKLQINDEGIVTKYLGAPDDEIVLIPSYYTKTNKTTGETEMYKIKGIASGLFKNNTNILGVSLGNFINEIPESAFEGCTSLKEVICPNVVRIGDNAFKGCSSLSEFSLPNEIEDIGECAFDGIPAIKSNAPTIEIANIVANSNIQNITLDISKIEEEDFSDMSFDVGKIETFKLLGGYKEYKGLNIKSNAKTTIISGVTISDCDVVPIELSSPNVTLERVTAQGDGFSIVLKADATNLSLEGVSNMLSESESSILTKGINFVQLNEETYSAINVNGNILVCGELTNNAGYVDEDKVVYITSVEYNNYLTQRKITFEANEGTASTEYIMVAYNSSIGELPTASRDYYSFDGWHTEPDGGEKVTLETIIKSDMTLYAHWTPNGAVWALASNVPEGAEIIDTKYTYTLRETTTSSSSTMSGWNLYNTSDVWGNYGNWSDWQDGWVGSSDSRDVETKPVYVSSNYKTVYRYYRRANSEHATTGSPYYGYGGNLYTYSFDYELDKVSGTDYSYKLKCNACGIDQGYHTVWRYGSLDMYAMPYTETVWVSDNYKTQYRYRDRYKIYTYHFEKYTDKESNTYPTQGEISNIQEWVQYRAK